jgi:hypothetical protein
MGAFHARGTRDLINLDLQLMTFKRVLLTNSFSDCANQNAHTDDGRASGEVEFGAINHM